MMTLPLQLRHHQDHIQVKRIAIVDGMVLIQIMAKKPAIIIKVKYLGQHYNDRLIILTEEFDEIILVLDTYKAD